MIRVHSSQLTERQRVNLSSDGNSNFVSFMIDRLNVVKKKLMYDGELFYLHTAPGCIPQVRLGNFISMKPHVTTNADNLFPDVITFLS